MPYATTWYCGWCRHGPNSLLLDEYCCSCYRQRDSTASFESSGADFVSTRCYNTFGQLSVKSNGDHSIMELFGGHYELVDREFC